MDNSERLLKYLKKKRYIGGDIEKLRGQVVSENVKLNKPTDLFIRDAITGIGTILEEDLAEHYYITTVKVGVLGNVLAQAIICRIDEDAEIAVYATEGFIPQGLARKALEKLKKALC